MGVAWSLREPSKRANWPDRPTDGRTDERTNERTGERTNERDRWVRRADGETGRASSPLKKPSRGQSKVKEETIRSLPFAPLPAFGRRAPDHLGGTFSYRCRSTPSGRMRDAMAPSRCRWRVDLAWVVLRSGLCDVAR